MPIFDDNFWWKFLMTILDNFGNFWQFFIIFDNWDNFWQFWKDSPGDLWHLRHWLQFWRLRTWIHEIFGTWQLIETLDSIRHSCDVYFCLFVSAICSLLAWVQLSALSTLTMAATTNAIHLAAKLSTALLIWHLIQDIPVIWDLKVCLLTSDFCIVPPGLYLLAFVIFTFDTHLRISGVLVLKACKTGNWVLTSE